MILELLILVFLLFIYAGGLSSDPLSDIKTKLDQILICSNKEADYRLILDNERTYVTDKKIIHLVVKKGKKFDEETLLHVAIHELAHIICPDLHHTPQFERIQENLLKTAIELKYLTPYTIVDPEYPCLD